MKTHILALQKVKSLPSPLQLTLQKVNSQHPRHPQGRDADRRQLAVLKMSTIFTPEVIEMFATWMEAFRTRWMFQPPEFTDSRYYSAGGIFHDHYMGRVGRVSARNPRWEPWFKQMILTGTEADLVAMDTLGKQDRRNEAYITFLQYELLGEAYTLDKAGTAVSAALPAWFRKEGWGLPDGWTCDSAPPVAAAAAPKIMSGVYLSAALSRDP